MAAVAPFIERQAFEVEKEETTGQAFAGFSGLEGKAKEIPQVEVSHGRLRLFVWSRQAAEAALEDRRFRVAFKAGEYWIELDQPLEQQAVPWMPLTGRVKKTRVLTWTGKMGCPSFSLPAGSPRIGGSCPGATVGQSVIDPETRRARLPASGLERVDLGRSICSHCYATTGNYESGNGHTFEVLRFAWVRRALAVTMQGAPTEDPAASEFVQIMVDAIRRADYLPKGGKRRGDEKSYDYGPEREQAVGHVLAQEIGGSRRPAGAKYFRIHDSGDFFSIRYLRAWGAICRAHPDVLFWAPSRAWASELRGPMGKFLEEEAPPNLVIRPSAYHVGAASPAIPGWPHSGSTALLKYWEGMADPALAEGPMSEARENMLRDFFKAAGKSAPERRPGARETRASWYCQTYATLNAEHNCREALNPDGKKGCRACWTRPEESINYAFHT